MRVENITIAQALGILKNDEFIDHMNAIQKAFGDPEVLVLTVYKEKKEKVKDQVDLFGEHLL